MNEHTDSTILNHWQKFWLNWILHCWIKYSCSYSDHPKSSKVVTVSSRILAMNQLPSSVWLIDWLTCCSSACDCGRGKTGSEAIWQAFIWSAWHFSTCLIHGTHTPAFPAAGRSTPCLCFVFCHVLFPRCNYSLQEPSIHCDIAPLWWSGLVWALAAEPSECEANPPLQVWRCRVFFLNETPPSFFSPAHFAARWGSKDNNRTKRSRSSPDCTDVQK